METASDVEFDDSDFEDNDYTFEDNSTPAPKPKPKPKTPASNPITKPSFSLVDLLMPNAKDTQKSRNVKAFLAMLRWAEVGTTGPAGYAICYKHAHTITNFSDHPYYTGAWKGEMLTRQQCKDAKLDFYPCYSTAAGGYQFVKGTWKELQRSIKLPDFTPHSQDLACIEKLRKLGALKHIEAGNFSKAIELSKATWASLPGNYANQGQKSFANLQREYKNAGGVIV